MASGKATNSNSYLKQVGCQKQLAPPIAQYDGYQERYNISAINPEEDRIRSEEEYEYRRQDLENQDMVIKDMWSRRYAATPPLYSTPIIDFTKPVPVKTVPQSVTKISPSSSSVSNTSTYSMKPSK